MKLSRHTFDELRSLIHRICGLVLSEEKAYLIQHRLEPVARANRCRSFEEFSDRLRGGALTALHEAVIEAITTNETSFFRDGHPFETFRQQVLPRLGEVLRSHKAAGRKAPQVRIWCAAASTGQEPYSLAMLVSDYVLANAYLGVSTGDFSILATDVSAKVLARAAAAEYSERDLVRGLSPAQIARYFHKQGAGWIVQEKVRKLVEFCRANLVHPFQGLGTFDVIFCRNVLIYFDDDTRRRICRQFHDMLTDEGSLILGSAENLYGVTDQFESVRYGETLVYRKLPSGRRS